MVCSRILISYYVDTALLLEFSSCQVAREGETRRYTGLREGLLLRESSLRRLGFRGGKEGTPDLWLGKSSL
jgi:hypothetical protein